MTFFFGSVVSLFNNIKTKFWPKEELKRRRDSLDDDEDDIYLGCEGLNRPKRSKWMTSATYPTRYSMAASGSRQPPKSWSTIPSKSSSQNLLGARSVSTGFNGTGRKTNEDDVIVIDSDDTKVESRSPLSDLRVQTGNNHGGAISRNSPRNRSHERKQNGLHSDIFHPFTNGYLRLSKSCSAPKLTAVSESFQLDQKQVYSQILNEFMMKGSGVGLQISVGRDSLVEDWPLVNSLPKKNKCQAKTLPKCIDLTKEEESSSVSNQPQNMTAWRSSSLRKADTNERIKLFCEQPGRHKNNGSTRDCLDLTGEDKEVKQCGRGRLNMKPRSLSASEQDPHSIEFLPERPVSRVNSLEKELAHNSRASSQWIEKIQKKYNEKERDMQRQVEETKLKKDLYSEHNHKRLNEALEDRIRRHLSLTDVVLDETEDEAPLPELTEEMMNKVRGALQPRPAGQVLVEGFGQQLKRMDFQTLNNLNWLNDEVINFYMCLLIERGKQEKYMPVYAFNTFFYPKLVQSGHSSLKRWTKKVDIFSHQMLFVPIHLGCHWCMATIDFRDKTVRYYDSMGSGNSQCLNALLKYLEDESLDKKKVAYDTSNWKKVNMKNVPLQMNGSDCGMFSCMFAEYLSRNAKLTFSQANMPYFRHKMVYEILTKQLLM